MSFSGTIYRNTTNIRYIYSLTIINEVSRASSDFVNRATATCMKGI